MDSMFLSTAKVAWAVLGRSHPVRWHEQREYPCTGSCFEVGITTSQALSRWKRTGNPVAGSIDPLTAGNGSLMRLALVAIRFWRDRPAMRDVASSATTHAAPEAIDACVAFAEVLADAKRPTTQRSSARPE